MAGTINRKREDGGGGTVVARQHKEKYLFSFSWIFFLRLPEPLNKSINKVDAGELDQSKENRCKTQDNINIQGCRVPNLIIVKKLKYN